MPFTLRALPLVKLVLAGLFALLLLVLLGVGAAVFLLVLVLRALLLQATTLRTEMEAVI